MKCHPVQAKSEPVLKLKPTSAHCWGGNHTNRICYFTNLYFSTDIEEFIFVHGDGSSYINIPDNIYNPALLDMSSVEDHNTQYFAYMDVSLEKFSNPLGKNISTVDGFTLCMKRFLPSNLMHIFHDDLLPIYYTIDVLKSKFNPSTLDVNHDLDVKLFYADSRPPGDYSYLYDIFSNNNKPLYLYDLLQSDNNSLICFSNVIVGVLKHTTWYQYGFKTFQGPLSDSKINKTIINKFTNFYKTKMNITNSLSDNTINKPQKGILLIRHKNRLILNEAELVSTLVNRLGIKIRMMSLESHTLNDIIAEISNAKFIMGMHGSLLILSIFLPPGSILVELFPYAVSLNNYTPFRTVVSIPGLNVSYIAWQNTDRYKTVTHPNRPAKEGGIGHLDNEERERIENSDVVSEHLCCQDPTWLFRIYQDTLVDIKEVIQLIKIKIILRPYRISNLKCRWQSDSSLRVTWDAPFNIKYLNYDTMHYDLILQNTQHLNSEDFISLKIKADDENSAVINSEIVDVDDEYLVWIRCVIDENILGPFNNINVFC
ncbi:hypothetical protein HELRODRAFT_105809 [Helobdella robusta]|uniref:Glycosyltransferase 61 catalytic domain-containing protein n=1 Tax=Helobdella robusta TaxID=6412 RepID=T1EDX7_HELRO|nr:hypothetical protein HELRODRAFT_105809 [Helobdella robusta]ESO13223.1 hypothetical protein HELRODRAFT_105809 [Helobdella robusta]